MKNFLSKYVYIFIWIGAIVGIGLLFVFVIHENSNLAPLPTTRTGILPTAPPPPPAPSVSLHIQKSKNGNVLLVEWQNLPDNTVALNIYRGTRDKPTSTWALFKHIIITSDNLASGNFLLNIGQSTLANYSFYVQAISNSSGNGTSTSSGGQANGDSTVVFTSSILQVTPVPPPPPPPSTTPPQTTQNNSNSTGNQNPATQNNNGNSSSTNSSSSTSQTPNGVPYYNPQIQISGYQSTQSDSFFVQHIDQKIQIGWRNIPAETTDVIVSRSPNQDGPWTVVLTQENPGATGSLQIVDNTLDTPYYYHMDAKNGSSTLAAYGPVYLPPIGQ